MNSVSGGNRTHYPHANSLDNFIVKHFFNSCEINILFSNIYVYGKCVLFA